MKKSGDTKANELRATERERMCKGEKKEREANENGQIVGWSKKLQAEGVEAARGIRVGGRETRRWLKLG